MEVIDLSMPIGPHFRWATELEITGDISADYLNRVETRRGHGNANQIDDDNQMALDLAEANE